MPEIGPSGLMSGDGTRSVAMWLKQPRPSSTLLMTLLNGARAQMLYGFYAFVGRGNICHGRLWRSPQLLAFGQQPSTS
jgi:hypothetical protein